MKFALLFTLPIYFAPVVAQKQCGWSDKIRCTALVPSIMADLDDIVRPPTSVDDFQMFLPTVTSFAEKCSHCIFPSQLELICSTVETGVDFFEGVVGPIDFNLSVCSSGASTASSRPVPDVPVDILKAVLTDTATEAGISVYDEEKHLAVISESLSVNTQSYGGASTAIVPLEDVSSRAIATPDSSLGVMSLMSSCDMAMFDFGVEAVALAMSAAGMPSGAGKRVARQLVKRAQKKLMKEMKGIVKDYFSSPNPVNIGTGLFKIMDIIIGDIGFNDLANIVTSNVSWFDGIKIVSLLSLYFLSGGGGLAAKLGFMTPAIIDVVEAGVEVTSLC